MNKSVRKNSNLFAFATFHYRNTTKIATEELHCALYQIARITGRVDMEDLLDIVFSDFCIGK